LWTKLVAFVSSDNLNRIGKKKKEKKTHFKIMADSRNRKEGLIKTEYTQSAYLCQILS
jgi:hypothetical protein